MRIRIFLRMRLLRKTRLSLRRLTAPAFCAFLTGVAANAEKDPAPETLTWDGGIAAIMKRHCIDCHRPGQAAPFSLLRHSDAAQRAEFLVEAVESGHMPPWLPDAGDHAFAGERRLSAEELERLRAWAEAGAPAGDKGGVAIPAPEEVSGWVLGEPDIVLEMEEAFEIPAVNRDIYRAFVLPFDAEKLPRNLVATARIPGSDFVGVAAAEVRPGNRETVHHALVFVDSTGKARRLARADPDYGYERFGDPGFEPSGFLGAYTPGSTPKRWPPGVADTLDLKGDIVIHIHYSPTGKPETDRTSVGIHLSREPVRRVTAPVRLGTFDIEIPPGAARHRVTDRYRLPADVFVLAATPHMHYLGRSVRVRAIPRDGGEATRLLEIRRWNFNWQDRWHYEEPVFLPAGTVIEAEWIFDNSAENPANPHDPPRHVTFGPDSSNEMAEVHLDCIPLDLGDYGTLTEAMEEAMRAAVRRLTPAQRKRYGFD
ncbi:MAG: hypothetical protein JJU00_05955 [Opitutales bacterium]|nr:hypothetical protein [Opitutales bacterium]